MELERRRRHRARLARHTETIARWREDFIAFASELDVVDKDGVRVRIRPTAMLAMFETQRNGRDIVLKPRQVYFTTWELARDLWWLITQYAAHVVVICQSDKDGHAIRELVMRVNIMLGLDSPGSGHGLIGRHPWLASMLRWEKGELRFGPARLEIKGAGASAAAARKVGRSGTVQRLHITEISSFEYAELTWGAIEHCVPSNERSEITIESTPQGAAGLFYELYTKAKNGANKFKTFFFNWLKHPEYRTELEPGEVIRVQNAREREMVRKYGASAEQVKWYRGKVSNSSQATVDQEYPMDEETCWLIAGRPFFNAERVKLLMTETTNPVRIESFASSVPDPTSKNELRIWREPWGREPFVVIADPSEGVVDGDPCAAAVYHRRTGEHVASVHGRWRTHEFAGVLEKVGKLFNTALIVVERVNHGHAVLNALLRLSIEEIGVKQGDPYPAIYHDPEDEKPGWKTGTVQRASAMQLFEAAVREGKWKTPDRDALVEMQRFVIDKTGKPCAAPGANDDRVLTHVIGWTILSVPFAPPPRTGARSGYRYGDSAEGGRGFY